uniref:Genome polyprotein n=1 Tax=Hibiscus chlorotic speck associated virus 3 TaxID=3143944 RepID=A0AAU7L1W2_9VIRU
MALKYRMPVEDVLNRFTSEEQSRVSSFALKKIVNDESFNSEAFAFAMSDLQKSKLVEAGINLSPHSYIPHSHPVCKTLENNLLFNVLPSIIDDSFYFIGIKNSKVNFLRKRHKKMGAVEVINRYVTSLDKIRYSNDFVVRSSSKLEGLDSKKVPNFSAALRDLIPECLKVKGRNFFLHDELHYWTYQDVCTFLTATNAEVLMATLVVPPELLIGATESLNPWCYHYEINKNNLLFYPDGKRDAMYVQPIDSAKWLKIGSINLPNGEVYKVDLVSSTFSHHLLSFTKGELLGQKLRSFSNFDAVSTKSLVKLGGSIRDVIPIPSDLIVRIYMYLRTLKKPDMQSAMAKLRQNVENIQPVHIKFFEAFCDAIIRSHTDQGMLKKDWIKEFIFFFQNLLPRRVAQLFSTYRSACLSDFIHDLKQLSFTVEVEDSNLWDEIKFSFQVIKFQTDFINPISMIDGLWDGSQRFIDLNFDDGSDTFIGKAQNYDPIIDQFTFFGDYEEKKFQSKGKRKEESVKNECYSRMYLLDQSAFDSIVKLLLQTLKPWLDLGDRFVFDILRQLILKMEGKVEPNFLNRFRNIVIDIFVKNLNLVNKEKVENARRRNMGPLWTNIGKWWFFCNNRRNTMCLPSNSNFNPSFLSENSYNKVLNQLSKVFNGKVDLNEVISIKQIIFKCQGIEINLGEPSIKGFLKGKIQPSKGLAKEKVDLSGSSSQVNANYEAALALALEENILDLTNVEFFNEGKGLSEEKPRDYGCSVETAITGKDVNSVDFELNRAALETKRKGLIENIKSESALSDVNVKEADVDFVTASDVTYNFIEVNCNEDSTFGNIVQDQILFSRLNFRGDLTLEVQNLLRGKKSTKYNDRESYLFSMCNCIQYGHSKVTYQNNPWSQLLSRLLPNDETPYNTCLIQVHEKGATTNFQADDSPCYGDSPIFTINLSGSARLSFVSKGNKVNEKETCSFSLNDNLAFIMPSGFQRKYKHSTSTQSEKRVSLTFRSHQLALNGGPINHVCGLIKMKRINGSIVSHDTKMRLSSFHIFEPTSNEDQRESYLSTISHLLGLNVDTLIAAFKKRVVAWRMNNISILVNQIDGKLSIDLDFLAACSTLFGLNQTIFGAHENQNLKVDAESSSDPISIFLFLNSSGLYSLCMPKNGCVIKAISHALDRRELDIIKVLSTEENCDLLKEISEGRGVNFDNLENFFEVFSIKARVQHEGRVLIMNSEGTKPRDFQIKDNHIEYIKGANDGGRRSPKVLEKKPVIFKDILDETLCGVLQDCDALVHEIDTQMAEILSNSLFDGTTGVISDGFFSKKTNLIESYKDLDIDYKRRVHVLVGVPGSGKTTFFKKKIFSKPNLRVVIVSPRRALLTQIKDDAVDALSTGRKKKAEKLPNNFKLCTYEQFLQTAHRFNNSLIILDEMQLFPNGYLDLTCILLKKDNNILVTGDPLQSQYDSVKDRHILNVGKNDLEKLLEGSSYNYNLMSHRFINSNFEGRLPFYISGSAIKCSEDHIMLNGYDELVSCEDGLFDAFLVPSFDEKANVKAYLGENCRCYTFGESTGMNFNSVAIICSAEALHTDENRWLTALTRARKTIAFVNESCNSFKDLAYEFSGRHLQRFLSRTATPSITIAALPGSPNLTDKYLDEEMKIGADEEVKELKLQGDPWLKTMIFLGQKSDIQMEDIEEQFDYEETIKTHIPNTHLESIRANWVDEIRSQETREFRIGHEISVQFCDDHYKGNGTVLTNAAERYEAIYPRHRGDDSVTFAMAVKKRLRFSNPAKEMKRFLGAKHNGKRMLNVFLEKIPLDAKMDPILMEKCVLDFEDKKTSKPAATIENHKSRSEVEWPRDEIFLFMKSQHCTKFSNRFRDAKAGQTLACFHHAVLCRFAPYVRYIERKLIQALPSNFYIHSGKAIEDLDAWVKRELFDGECTESDYEAFDSSQDHFIMAFEVELMKFLNFPNDLVEDYIFIKTHLGCKLGSLAIMRFTGEASTFLFNTLANMLFTFMRYDLNGSESICFAGDDMCANKRLKTSSKFNPLLDKIRLKAKVDFTNRPSFCGWQLTRYGVFKKPQLVLERINIAKERNNLHNCLDSYAIEVSYAYRMGELLNSLLDEEGMNNHYECVRCIIKNKDKLKSSVVDLFTNLYYT